MAQIREKEADTEKKVQAARIEADDRLRQMAVENELRLKQVRESLEEKRLAGIRETEERTAEMMEEVLALARKEAESMRENAMTRMEEAVTLVTEAVLGKA